MKASDHLPRLPVTAEETDMLFAHTRSSMGESLRRAMHSACTTADGQARPISQHDLAARAGVARSSIAKYLTAGQGEGDLANPDLRSLCRLAHALNIPPAFLLMRPEDWQRLVMAALYMANAMHDPEIQATTKAIKSGKHNADERASVAMKIAKRLGVDPGTVSSNGTDTSSALAREVESVHERWRLGLMTTCALPPLGRMDSKYHAALLCLCATFGATSN
jgi:Helix-turn-helix